MINLSITSGSLKLDRWDHLKNLIEVYASVGKGVAANYEKVGLQYVDVPAIVGITGACENVDTLFKVGNHLGLPLFFTQTGQLSLEQALQKFEGVWTTIYSGRDEELEDVRHLRQFRLTEEEFGWSMVSKSKKYDEDEMFENLLVHIEKAAKSAIAEIIKNNLKVLAQYDCSVKDLNRILKEKFYRISYDEAVDLLRNNGFANLSWGDDLKANHEQSVIELLGKRNGMQMPTFVMKYPKDIKFFNMKVWTTDPRVVLSADLILPISGESAGSAVREHDGKKLKDRLLSSNMFRLHNERGGTYDDFTWYTEDLVMAGKTQPHAGYGLGNERLVQFVLGLKDIRQASVMSLMAKESHDWDEKRRGCHKLLRIKKRCSFLWGKLRINDYCFLQIGKLPEMEFCYMRQKERTSF